MIVVILMILISWLTVDKKTYAVEPEFTAEFRLGDCEFKTTGNNPYFMLTPGYRLVLEGEEDDEVIVVSVTILHEKEDIYLKNIG